VQQFIEGAVFASVSSCITTIIGIRSMLRKTTQPTASALPTPAVPKPICGCGHGLHDHDPEKKTCAARVRLFKYSIGSGHEVFDKYGNCSCKQYVGPIPYTEFYMPEQLPPE
jgi:hypothetical protein